MFKGCASRWAWQSLPALETRLGKFLGGQVLRSQEYAKAADHATADLVDRCLPWHGSSTFGLVMSLLDWAAASCKQGGYELLRTRRPQRACSLLGSRRCVVALGMSSTSSSTTSSLGVGQDHRVADRSWDCRSRHFCCGVVLQKWGARLGIGTVGCSTLAMPVVGVV